MSIGPIPRSAARDYAQEMYSITGDAFDDFWGALHKVDDEYLKLVSARSSESVATDDGDKPAKRPHANPVSKKAAK